ncbi:mechanosensitive ion channel family protein [Atopomonas sediminilitoris]|uniref:mechanosensitive ion channel family protein n=1 Tax=Atopomonas sediminilitoris TaxID=2919919 RepID=UPI001F4E2248|nr:mechanosensitive ion channel domain-containing protein [Atopomonas sediminilitoris]MCJ8167820.1 mechanosensitive ion channel [Atopomonas sediminilitoris]
MPLDIWTQGLVSAMTTLWGKIAAFIPNLLGAVVLVILGFVVAKLLDALITKVLAKLGLDRLMTGSGVDKLLKRIGVGIPVSALTGKVIYWFIVLVFAVSAVEVLGLDRVSNMLDSVVLYLPKLFSAVLLMLGGTLLAHFAYNVSKGAAEGIGLDYAHAMGRLSQGLVLIITISVAISQLQIKTELLNLVIAIVLVTFGLAAALSIGLGSRQVASQILAGIYIRELYEVGEEITLDAVCGEIEEIGTVKTVLLLASGERLTIPNRLLLEGCVKSR